MSSPAPTGKTLAGWEKVLATYCARISSLGEIPLTPGDIDEIGRLLAAALKRNGPTEFARIAPRFRCTLITYMAAIAARNDNRGYWDALCKSLGVSGAAIQRVLGEAFEEAVREIGLPDYADAGGYRFVTPIRLHGGIPAYSLADFFEYVVLPAAHQPDYVGLPPDKCIELLLKDNTVQLFVDSPALNYLAYGGAVAEKYFQSCREMAQAWQRQGDLPPAQELGLPGYVVAAFRDFMENRLQTTADQKRLRAPQLLLDPYSPVELYRLELPAEPVDVERASWRYRWQIQALGGQSAGRRITTPVRVRRIGYELTTAESDLSLLFPPAPLRVELLGEPPNGDGVQCVVIGRWTVNLTPPPGQPPLLAFRASSGQAVRASQTLPADVLWLLYPVAAQLEADGGGRCRQRFPKLTGDWREWRIEEWDLSNSASLLLRSGRETWPVAIRGREQEPHLEGGVMPEGVRASAETPFYVGEPPRIWLPARSDNLVAWRVAVWSHWAASPELPRRDPLPLGRWENHLISKDGGLELPLAVVLGERPLGSYTVRVEGPRRSQHEFRLRIWPTLRLQDWQPYYLPEPHGAQPVEFGVCVGPEKRVMLQPGAEGVTVAPSAKAGCFNVLVAPTATEAPLFLEADRPGNEPVRVAIQVTVARLRWALHVDTGGSEWTATPIQRPVDALLQSQGPRLSMELPAATWPACRLVLVDAADMERELQMSARVNAGTGQQRVHIPLAEFGSTLRHYSDCPVFAFALDVGVGREQTRLPLLYFNRSLEVEKVHMDWEGDGRLRLHWQARHLLRNRRVRLWSAWQPWTSPHEFLIPDEAEPSTFYRTPGSGALTVPEVLPRGWYHVALRAAPSWEPLYAPPAPTEDALLVQGIPASERLEQLKPAREKGSLLGLDLIKGFLRGRITSDQLPGVQELPPFQRHFEQACIYDTLGEREKRQDEVRWLADNVEQAETQQLFAFYLWLGQRDTQTQQEVRIRMYYPDHFARMTAEGAPPTMVNLYLDQFTMLRVVKPESALLALRCNSRPDVVTHGLRILLAREHPDAVTHLLEQMEIGALSVQDASVLLKENLKGGLRVLRKEKTSPLRERLIATLLPYDDTRQLIGLGFWIRCEAGWGRIDKIHLAGQELKYFDPEFEQPVLDVTLRPSRFPEKITLDLATKTITFIEGGKITHCKKPGCPGFASASLERVREDHTHAMHKGLGPHLLTGAASWRYHLTLEYQSQPPKNQLA